MVVDKDFWICEKIELSFVSMKFVISHVTGVPRAVDEPPFVVEEDDIPVMVGVLVGCYRDVCFMAVSLGVSTDRLRGDTGFSAEGQK